MTFRDYAQVRHLASGRAPAPQEWHHCHVPTPHHLRRVCGVWKGAYRMRGIATGQRINVLVVPEVAELMRRELEGVPTHGPLLGAMSEEERFLEQIVCWLILNSLE